MRNQKRVQVNPRRRLRPFNLEWLPKQPSSGREQGFLSPIHGPPPDSVSLSLQENTGEVLMRGLGSQYPNVGGNSFVDCFDLANPGTGCNQPSPSRKLQLSTSVSLYHQTSLPPCDGRSVPMPLCSLFSALLCHEGSRLTPTVCTPTFNSTKLCSAQPMLVATWQEMIERPNPGIVIYR